MKSGTNIARVILIELMSKKMSELARLRNALSFLTQHLPGATELAELAENGSVVLDSQRHEDPDKILTGKKDESYNPDEFQKALDEFKKRNFSNLEIGRLYERYIGYLHEKENWQVAYTGVLGGYEDLGRDLVCIKDNHHKIIQAKCWSQRREVRENHIYQLNSTVIHYRIQMREALYLEHGRQNGRKMMKDLDITGHLYTTTSLSEMADKVAKHLVMEYVNEPLNKTYPMIKCNINQRTKDKRYHLPFDPQYDSIIIGNVEEECYVNTIAEAEARGFRRVGYPLV